MTECRARDVVNKFRPEAVLAHTQKSELGREFVGASALATLCECASAFPSSSTTSAATNGTITKFSKVDRLPTKLSIGVLQSEGLKGKVLSELHSPILTPGECAKINNVVKLNSKRNYSPNIPTRSTSASSSSSALCSNSQGVASRTRKVRELLGNRGTPTSGTLSSCASPTGVIGLNHNPVQSPNSRWDALPDAFPLRMTDILANREILQRSARDIGSVYIHPEIKPGKLRDAIENDETCQRMHARTLLLEHQIHKLEGKYLAGLGDTPSLINGWDAYLNLALRPNKKSKLVSCRDKLENSEEERQFSHSSTTSTSAIQTVESTHILFGGKRKRNNSPEADPPPFHVKKPVRESPVKKRRGKLRSIECPIRPGFAVSPISSTTSQDPVLGISSTSKKGCEKEEKVGDPNGGPIPSYSDHIRRQPTLDGWLMPNSHPQS